MCLYNKNFLFTTFYSFFFRLKECTAYLSNYEVLNILQSMKSNKKQKSEQQLATITYQTVKYLENTPSSKHSPEKIHNFLKAVEPYKLTKCEKLTLLNLCPKTAVEIQLVRKVSFLYCV